MTAADGSAPGAAPRPSPTGAEPSPRPWRVRVFTPAGRLALVEYFATQEEALDRGPQHNFMNPDHLVEIEPVPQYET